MAGEFIVTRNTDNGLGNTTGTLSWAIRQANAVDGDDTITLATNVTITGVMKTLINSNVVINGGGFTVSGDQDSDGMGDFRPFFIKSGTVAMNDLTIADGLALGGTSGLGGGGAGMGGGLFIYDGNVTLNNLIFTNNRAIGGNALTRTFGHGGGGMYGSTMGVDAYGGGGLFAHATTPVGAYGGLGTYGGSGGRRNSGNNSQGTDGGFGGGGGGYGDSFGVLFGGDGGFGGGGGGAYLEGGNGGFGGGGGFADRNTSGGHGGFGGGGSASRNATGGFGGGIGGANRRFDSGSGAGMGGAVFIRSGNLTIANSTFSNNSAAGGTGGNPGQGLGGAIFALHTLTNSNSNQQGMPQALPEVMLQEVTFADNSATDNSNSMVMPWNASRGTFFDTEDVFGNRVTRITTPRVQFTAASFSDRESVGLSRSITLTRDLAIGSSVVQLSITGGTATPGDDYGATGFPLGVIFADGETTKTVALPIIDDSLMEDNETITLSIIGVSNARLGAQTTGTFTILDNDDILPSEPTPSPTLPSDSNNISAPSPAPDPVLLPPGSDNSRFESAEPISPPDSRSPELTPELTPELIPESAPDPLAPTGTNIRQGTPGRDRLQGSNADDILFGGGGNDTLIGSGGNDLMVGGPGNNRMRGGSGSDTFLLEPGQGFARILDFNPQEDKLGLVKGIRQGALDITGQGRKTRIALGDDVLTVLTGTSPDQITRRSFISVDVSQLPSG
jgi:hypothetical protein